MRFTRRRIHLQGSKRGDRDLAGPPETWLNLEEYGSLASGIGLAAQYTREWPSLTH